jgi:hypothetical protein
MEFEEYASHIMYLMFHIFTTHRFSVRKQELCDLYKTIFLELGMINKNDVIVVAMATMPFQHGRH